jgi:hypothetical protein
VHLPIFACLESIHGKVIGQDSSSISKESLNALSTAATTLPRRVDDQIHIKMIGLKFWTVVSLVLGSACLSGAQLASPGLVRDGELAPRTK